MEVKDVATTEAPQTGKMIVLAVQVIDSPKCKNSNDNHCFSVLSLSKNSSLLFSTHFPLTPCQETGIALRLQPFPGISVSRSCTSCNDKETPFPANRML